MATVIDSLYFQYHYIFSVSVMASNNVIGIAEMKRGTTMNWLFESWGIGFVHGVQFNIKKAFYFVAQYILIFCSLILQNAWRL
jgi:hypothetical protein